MIKVRTDRCDTKWLCFYTKTNKTQRQGDISPPPLLAPQPLTLGLSMCLASAQEAGEQAVGRGLLKVCALRWPLLGERRKDAPQEPSQGMKTHGRIRGHQPQVHPASSHTVYQATDLPARQRATC